MYCLYLYVWRKVPPSVEQIFRTEVAVYATHLVWDRSWEESSPESKT